MIKPTTASAVSRVLGSRLDYHDFEVGEPGGKGGEVRVLNRTSRLSLDEIEATLHHIGYATERRSFSVIVLGKPS